MNYFRTKRRVLFNNSDPSEGIYLLQKDYAVFYEIHAA